MESCGPQDSAERPPVFRHTVINSCDSHISILLMVWWAWSKWVWQLSDFLFLELRKWFTRHESTDHRQCVSSHGAVGSGYHASRRYAIRRRRSVSQSASEGTLCTLGTRLQRFPVRGLSFLHALLLLLALQNLPLWLNMAAKVYDIARRTGGYMVKKKEREIKMHEIHSPPLSSPFLFFPFFFSYPFCFFLCFFPIFPFLFFPIFLSSNSALCSAASFSVRSGAEPWMPRHFYAS